MTTEERLEKLEKELMRGRRFNCWLLAGLGLVIVVWVVGWAFRPGTATAQPAGAAAREVRACRFILEDENGKTRAWLEVNKDGPILSLFDEKDKPRAILKVDKTGPGLGLSDENGKPRVILSVDKDCPILTLSAEQGQLDNRAAQAESRAGEERRAADQIRRTIDAAQLEAISAAAQEANGIIDQRVFSWTDLFNCLETTLPSTVRMTSITPRVDRDGQMYVSMVVVGRSIEDIDDFIAKLETSGAFADLLSRQQSVNNEGLLETTLDGRYLRAPGMRAAGRDE